MRRGRLIVCGRCNAVMKSNEGGFDPEKYGPMCTACLTEDPALIEIEEYANYGGRDDGQTADGR